MTHYVVFMLLLGTIACRGRNMDSNTPLRARIQYWVPLLPALASLPPWPTHAYASELMGSCLLLFLWMERRRPTCVQGPGDPHGPTPTRCPPGAEFRS